MTWYAFPEQQRDLPLDDIGPETEPIQGAADFRRRHPDGRRGADPSLATAEAGERLVNAALDDLAADYRHFVEVTGT